LKEIIQEQKAEINNLNDKLLRVEWVINYLEQRNKQLEDEHTLIDLQQIREDQQAARRHIHEMTPIEQEIEADRETWLERVNIHLEKLLAKANRDKDMLRHMKHHYWTRMRVNKARVKVLKKRLSQALKRQKRLNPLRVLAEASLAEHNA